MVVFQGGEKVLAYHGPLLYEATIIHIFDEDPDQVYYRVHYRGWAKKWDEDVTKERILPISEKNLQFKTQLEERIRKNQVARMSGNQQNQKNQAEGGLASKADMEIEESTAPAIELSIPHGLKIILVNDWRRITRDGRRGHSFGNRRLFPDSVYQALVLRLNRKTPRFPRQPNADVVLDDFLDRASRRYDGARRKHAKDVVSGLKDWLDQAVPLCLLYDQERPVFDTAIQSLHDTLDSRNSTDGDSDEESRGPKARLVVGCEHLLRLFVKLPWLLGLTSASSEYCSIVQTQCVDLMDFILRNEGVYLSTDN